MKDQLKVVIAGPTGAGKTTAVSTISDVPVVTTEERSTDLTSGRKPTTTVALDFGSTTLGGFEPIHIYGAPGQERFSFMWDILADKGSGLILLCDNSSSDPIADMSFYLNVFKHYIAKTKLVIGITRTDLSQSFSIDEYKQALNRLRLNAPILVVDARCKNDVSKLLKTLLSAI